LARARFISAEGWFLAGDRERSISELRHALGLLKSIGTDQFAVVEGQHAEDLVVLGVAEGLRECRGIAKKIDRLRALGEALLHGDEDKAHQAVGRLEVYAFGEARVVRDSRTITSSEWQAATVKELFFFILIQGPLERDAIGVVFWPDLSAKSMTDSFHTTLYRLRRALGSNVVTIDNGRYRIGDVDYWFDVNEFEEIVDRARLLPAHDWQAEELWRRAVALYQGDFLADVDRMWALPLRERYGGMYLEALMSVARCHEIRGEPEGAIDWYRRVLEVDELREDIHREVMLCYCKAGRRTDAIAQYHRCRDILNQELGIEPEQETERIYEDIAGKR
jgi:two-component SAPR family response regulator